MIKKMTALLIALVLAVSCMPFTAYAAKSSITVFNLKHLPRIIILEIIVSALFVNLKTVRCAGSDFPKLRIAVIGYIKRT